MLNSPTIAIKGTRVRGMNQFLYFALYEAVYTADHDSVGQTIGVAGNPSIPHFRTSINVGALWSAFDPVIWDGRYL